MQVWVSRMGQCGGDPRAATPHGIDQERINILTLGEVRRPLTYNHLPLIADELFRHGRLRQGWGFPGLDLRQPENR
jgi:hypothetical protein